MHLLAALLVLLVGSVTPQSSSATAVASDPKPILTSDQQRKLVNLMETYGRDASLSNAVTAALGLSKGDEVLTLRQLGDNEPPLLHAYIPLPDGGILLGLRDTVAAWNYRLDASLKLVGAVSKNRGRQPTVIPMPDAERNVEIELKFWAGVADRH